MNKLLIIGAVVLVMPCLAHAQEVQRDEAGTWVLGLIKVGTPSPWKFSLEAHERTWGFFNAQTLTILRPAVHRDLSDHVEAALGASWITSPPNNQEFNAWEQLTFSGRTWSGSWATRIREEQRWLRQGLATEQGEEPHPVWTPANRLRLRFTFKHPLPLGEGKWYGEGFVEWWMTQDASFRMTQMERVWHTLAVGRNLNEDWAVQISALQQRDATPGGWKAHLIGQATVIWSGNWDWNGS